MMLLLFLLPATPFAVAASSRQAPGNGARPEAQAVPPVSSDARIQHAIAWLSPAPTIPIDIVDPDRLSRRLMREVRRACGFVIRGVPRIYISSRCPAYRWADRNPFAAIALAAVIQHELAHLEGADEARARAVEADLVQTLSARLPGTYRARAAEYIAGLRLRRSPVDCETHPSGIAFHTCRAEVAELGGAKGERTAPASATGDLPDSGQCPECSR